MSFETIHFELARPLLIIKGSKGFLACGYINPLTADKTGEACAIVTGVNSFDDMRTSSIVAVSSRAAELGVSVGDSGESALRVFE